MSINNLQNLDDVKHATSQLTNLTYVQRSANKTIIDDSFNEGEIVYDFTIGGNRWWIPSKTHFVIRSVIKKEDASAPDDDVYAASQFFAANLFQGADFRIEGRSVSKVSNYLPQVYALKQRLTKSVAQRTTVGASLNNDVVSRVTRAASVVVNNEIETVFQPPLAIFDEDTPLPPGNYSIVLTPNTKYDTSAVERKPLTTNNGQVQVKQMHLYVATVDGETPPKDFSYYLDLQEVRCTPQTIRNAEEHQDITVKPSTYAISVALQHETAGSSQDYPPVKFSGADGDERKLERLRIQYASQTVPSPDANPSYAGKKDHMTRMYNDTLLNTNMLWSAGGVEDKVAWLTSPIYHYQFLKQSGDTSTHATINYSFSSITAAPNLLVFDWFSNVAMIQYRDGRILTTQTESA